MPSTRIHVILDRSGSMESCLNDTIGGFNSFLRQQKNITSDSAYLSLYQFNNNYEIIYQDKNINEVPDLTIDTFIPNGQTALLDAIGKTINSVNEYSYTTEDTVIIVIITDGEENSSCYFEKNIINKMIEEKKQKGWQFVFLGANQDAIEEGAKLGIGANSSLSYAVEDSQEAFQSISQAISRVRSVPPQTPQRNIHFTPQERALSMNSTVMRNRNRDRLTPPGSPRGQDDGFITPPHRIISQTPSRPRRNRLQRQMDDEWQTADIDSE